MRDSGIHIIIFNASSTATSKISAQFHGSSACVKTYTFRRDFSPKHNYIKYRFFINIPVPIDNHSIQLEHIMHASESILH